MNRKVVGRSLAGTILLAGFCSAVIPAHSDDEATWVCTAHYSCPVCIDVETAGAEGNTQPEAETRATGWARSLRRQCSNNQHNPGTIQCCSCNLSLVQRAPSDRGQRLTAANRSAVAAACSSPQIMLVHKCLTRTGRLVQRVKYGPREDLEVLSDHAWTQITADAAGDGGIAPGSEQSRIEDRYQYFVYQTVRSVNSAHKVHRELTLEGRGGTAEDAQKALNRSVKKVTDDLAAIGETAQTVGNAQPVEETRIPDGVITVNCFYRCITVDGWTVFASEFGLDDVEASAKASTIAKSKANDYGGPTSTGCSQIQPHEQWLP
jgi:hypothetical protein